MDVPITPKDFRLIEIMKALEEKNLVTSLQEYHILLDTMVYLNEAMVDHQVQIPGWKKDSEKLLYKFYLHGLSLHNLCQGNSLKSHYYPEVFDGKNHIDLTSIKVLLRCQFETFLMFHHIYINSKDETECQLRHHAWMQASLMQRQTFPANTAFGKRRKQEDLHAIRQLTASLQQLPTYHNLTDKQQQALNKVGSGKLFKSWSKIMEETGFDENHSFYTLYTIMCMHAHAEGVGILQVDKTTRDESSEAVYLDIHQSKMLVCRWILNLCCMFEVVRDRFQNLKERDQHTIELFSSMIDYSRHSSSKEN